MSADQVKPQPLLTQYEREYLEDELKRAENSLAIELEMEPGSHAACFKLSTTIKALKQALTQPKDHIGDVNELVPKDVKRPEFWDAARIRFGLEHGPLPQGVEQIAALQAYIEQGAQGWMPISTAPKDGAHILGEVLYTDQAQTVVYFGTFHPNSPGRPVWRDAFSKRPVQDFTRWQPLPNGRPVPPAPPSGVDQ